jgi:EF hand
MKITKKISLFVILTLCCVNLGIAQETIPLKVNPRATKIAEMLKRYDVNKNGKLDKEEVEAIGRDRLLEEDLNKDGKVDEVELKCKKSCVRTLSPMTAKQRDLACEKALLAEKIQKEKERKQATTKQK